MPDSVIEPLVPVAHVKVAPSLYERKKRRRESSGNISTACDQCYRCKVKCSGEKPTCERCKGQKSACTYSTGKPLGKPKGSKNKFRRTKSAPGSTLQPLTLNLDQVTLPLYPVKHELEDGPIETFSDPGPFLTSSPTATSHLSSPILDLSTQLRIHDSITTEPLHVSLPSIASGIAFSFDTTQKQSLVESTAYTQNPSINTSLLYSSSNPPNTSFSWAAVELGDAPIQAWSMPASHKSNASHQSLLPAPSTGSIGSQTCHASMLAPLTTACLCDPLGMDIIAELQSVQIPDSRLDMTLLQARRGLDIVSACIACAQCYSSSGSLLFKCVIILQHIFNCYGALRITGLKMLDSATRFGDGQPEMEIGDFQVYDGEGRFGILNMIVRFEMEKSKSVLGALEAWAERAATGAQNTAKLLLRTLKDELHC